MKSFTKILILVLAATPGMAQLAMNDLFNRPDGNSLGVDWTEQDGDAKIAGNMLLANSPQSFGWASHDLFSGNYMNTVVRAKWAMNGGGGDRISLIAGVEPSNWSGIEVRIADNDGDGLADRIFFHAAVNAGAWFVGGTTQIMTTPLASGEATLWFSNNGDTANVDIKDLATGAVQSYSKSGILTNAPVGGRVGIGYFGNGTVDDFQAWSGSPAGPIYTITATRVGHAPTILVDKASPWAPIVIAYSVTGQGPIYTPFGVVGLTEPIYVALQTYADATGRLEIPLGPLSGTAGALLFTQAADLSGAAPVLTNTFAVTLI
jgi:hypothetical protein